MSLTGRTVLVTGAGQGIGLGVAKLAADGWTATVWLDQKF